MDQGIPPKTREYLQSTSTQFDTSTTKAEWDTFLQRANNSSINLNGNKVSVGDVLLNKYSTQRQLTAAAAAMNLQTNNTIPDATGVSLQISSALPSYIGMDTSQGPDRGNQACLYAVNKVLNSKGINVPWGDSVYVPFAKDVLDKTATLVDKPVPGAIAIMQDNHPTAPYPHVGIVDEQGNIVSNSSSRARFDWVGTPKEYESKYGKKNLYYVL